MSTAPVATPLPAHAASNGTAFNCRRAHELVGVTLDIAMHDATDGDNRPVAACVMLPSTGAGFPVASGAMDGVKLSSIQTAANKCSTCLAWGCNTANLADYTQIDVMAAQASHGYFCPWDGGIRLYDSYGTLICVLAVSGRSALGDRILAVKAAHQLGYRTDFNEDGLTEAEAKTAINN